MAGNLTFDALKAAVSSGEIDTVLTSLSSTDPWMHEMSGSGATCFALYESAEIRDRAAQKLAAEHSDWWQMKGFLR